MTLPRPIGPPWARIDPHQPSLSVSFGCMWHVLACAGGVVHAFISSPAFGSFALAPVTAPGNRVVAGRHHFYQPEPLTSAKDESPVTDVPPPVNELKAQQ